MAASICQGQVEVPMRLSGSIAARFSRTLAYWTGPQMRVLEPTRGRVTLLEAGMARARGLHVPGSQSPSYGPSCLEGTVQRQHAEANPAGGHVRAKATWHAL